MTALPKFVQPQYEIEIPSTGKKIFLRPFNVGEEKALLLAQQSENLDNMIATLKQVLTSCTSNKIKVDDLATFDLEYLFCQLRGKSVGEMIEMKVKCDVCKDENAVATFNIDITKVPVKTHPDHKKKIPLFESVGVVMKYPDFGILKKIKDEGGRDVKTAFHLVSSCIDYIYNADEVWLAKDMEGTEVLDFLESLSGTQFKQILQFFETMPSLQLPVKYICPVCKKPYSKVLEGLESFFT